MNRKLPFEEAFHRRMSDLPPGDEENAWQQMKLLLEKEDDRKRFLFFRKYGWLAVALLLCCFITWFVLVSNSNHFAKTVSKEESDSNKKSRITEKPLGYSNNNRYQNRSLKDTSSQTKKSEYRSGSVSIERFFSLQKEKSSVNNKPKTKESTAPASKPNSALQISSGELGGNINQTADDKESQLVSLFSQNKKQSNENAGQSDIAEMSKPADSLQHHLAFSDSGFLTHSETQTNAEVELHSSANKKSTIKINKKTRYSVTGGLLLKQEIPLPGQKLTAYDYNGNKNITADYLPAVYLRFENKNKWFIQAEFGYAAPHLIKPFVYQQKTFVDYSHGSVTQSQILLQKAYFNELPVSFHYDVRPNWSVGAGISFNWFRGAVSSQTTSAQNAFSDSASVISQRIFTNGFTDSFFYRSNTSLLLQTSYHKNRWSFFLRYNRDVNPFMRYTAPNGNIVYKRNAGLQFAIGYQLFRSSRFSLQHKNR